MTMPLQYFQYGRGGALQAEGVSLEKIAEPFGTPAFVYSKKALLEPLLQLQAGLQPIRPLICFAAKANSNSSILKILRQADAGMDIVSKGELALSLKAGVAPSKIIFSGVGKTAPEMTAALKAGIFAFNVESEPELRLLDAVARQMRLRAPVSFRYTPDVDPKTHPYIATGLQKNKFGLERKEILPLVKRLADFPHVELRGLSIHIGSQILSPHPFEEAFQKLSSFAAELTSALPEPLSFLSLGGGLGIAYHLNEKGPSIRDYCACILRHFGPKRWKGKIVLEPGRLIAGNAGVLLTRVLYRKHRNSKDILIVDAGMNDLMRPALYGSYHEIVPLDRSKQKGPLRKTDIVGPVCESADCFCTRRPFPASIKEGDWLAILSAGAYGYSMGGTYNSRPRPPEILVSGGRFLKV